MSTFAADLLINGTSIRTVGAVADWSGIFSDGPLRGGNLTYPGLAGEVHLPKVRDAYDFTVPLVIRAAVGGAQRADVVAALESLRTLLNSTSTALTMTRVKPLPAGGTASQTAQGDYVAGLEPEFVGFTAGRIAVVLRNLSGSWT